MRPTFPMLMAALLVTAPHFSAAAAKTKVQKPVHVLLAQNSAQTPTPTPAETANPTSEPSASPTATPAAATPTPTPAPSPSPTPKKKGFKEILKEGETSFVTEHKRQCARHYQGLIQGEIRAACNSAAEVFPKVGKDLSQTRCRLSYGEEPRLVMACLVGSMIADDIQSGRDDYKKRLQLCSEHYPVHTEIDAFLQESCMTGIHMPGFMKTDGRAKTDVCAQVQPERSFVGPCAVGLSLAQEIAAGGAAPKTSPAQQNQVCEQYFDHKRFHSGYRACLISRSMSPSLPTDQSEAIRNCSNLVGETGNDTERAACLVGVNILRHLQRSDDVSKKFQKCGDNKVSYQQRDFLACLTAASLSDFKGSSETGCREVFKSNEGKRGRGGNRGRSDCLNSLSLF